VGRTWAGTLAWVLFYFITVDRLPGFPYIISMDKIKKVWFQHGRSWECYACRPPYTQEDIIREGISYEEWIRIPTKDCDKKS